jgi:hypothetical protein
MSRKRRSGEKMWIQQQAKVKVFGAAMILALMFLCSIAAFAAITASTTSLQFPSTTVGVKSAPMTVTISNTSKASVIIESATVSEAQFRYSGPAFPITLAEGQSFTGSVTFTPSAAKAYSGELEFRHFGGSTISMRLTGTGTAVVVSETLTASSSALSFSAQVGAAAPAAQSLTIGDSPASVKAFAVSADQTWISLSAASGTTSSAIQVGANISGLAAGSYSGHVIVTASGVTNSPMSIPVTLVVAAAQTYALTASSSALSFSATAGGTAPAAQSLTIGDSPASAKAFAVSADQTWISLSAASGTTSSAIQVGASISGLAAGSYSGHVIVTASGVTNSPMSIPVTLVVAAAQGSALMSLSTAPAFTAQVGGAAPAAQTLTIVASPSAFLPVTTTADQPWISVSGGTATTKAIMQVSASVAGMAAGTYSGHVIVTSPGAPNSPMSIPVTMVITAAAPSSMLTATPSAMAFSAVAGGTAPALQSLTIGDSPVSAAPFTVTADQAWMTLSAASGTTSGAIQVGANISGLAAGNYTGHVITTASGMTNSPMSVTVTLAVTAAQTSLLNVSPTSAAFGNINVGNNNTNSITITNSGTSSVTISSISVAGAGMSANGIATPMTLAAGQTTVLSVVFAPTAVGAVSGTVSVVSSATNSPGVITTTGTGVQPQLTASPVSLNFGNVAVGSSGSQTITLSNTGTAAATVSQAVVSGTGYTMSGLVMPMTLAAGASTSFSVQFAPTSAGSDSGSVTVTSNTPNSPTMVATSGTGTAPVAHSVSLSWVASTSQTVVGYNIYRGSVSGGPYTVLNSTPNAGLTYTDMTVTAGQTYYYVVTAVDGSGNESVVSNEVAVTIPTP